MPVNNSGSMEGDSQAPPRRRRTVKKRTEETEFVADPPVETKAEPVESREEAPRPAPRRRAPRRVEVEPEPESFGFDPEEFLPPAVEVPPARAPRSTTPRTPRPPRERAAKSETTRSSRAARTSETPTAPAPDAEVKSSTPPVNERAPEERGSTERVNSERASSERASSERSGAERTLFDRAAERSSDYVAADFSTSERAPEQREVPERSRSDRSGFDRGRSHRGDSYRGDSYRSDSRGDAERAPSDRTGSDRASSDRASSDRASSDRASSDRASGDRYSDERSSSDPQDDFRSSREEYREGSSQDEQGEFVEGGGTGGQDGGDGQPRRRRRRRRSRNGRGGEGTQSAPQQHRQPAGRQPGVGRQSNNRQGTGGGTSGGGAGGGGGGGGYGAGREGDRSRGPGRGPGSNNRRGSRDTSRDRGRPDNRDSYRERSSPMSEQAMADIPGSEVAGVLELHPKGYGFLRDPGNNYASAKTDAFVSGTLIEKVGLREGVLVRGEAIPGPKGQGPRLRSIQSVDGKSVEDYQKVKVFDTLTAINPCEQIKLETGPSPVTMRVMDLLCPIGKGQRALIVAPPRTGKTMLLQEIANAVSKNHPEMYLIVLLIDERPEEVTEMRRNVRGEVIASSMDRDVESHVRIAQLIIERGKRIAEAGGEVFILLDSITRTARAFNKWVGNTGRTTTGGLDVKALDIPKKLFGTARLFDEGGSLTIAATALIETGSRMDDVIFQEFKGTGNMEMVLSRQLADRRIWPAIDIQQSGTRREEKILNADTLEGVTLLRRSLVSLSPVEAMEQLTRILQKYPSNKEFLGKIKAIL